MGWDGLRLTFWGDWEASDSDGNLVANDHQDLLDYLIARARERGIYMLLSPIQLYNSNWPDALADSSAPGFGRRFGKARIGTDPLAIAAQMTYLRQILEHVNPYTRVALKDEPAILFIELVNEPWHHPEDLEGSVRYINALTDAVRSTGCTKLVFYNVSEDFRIAEAFRRSRAQGGSCGGGRGELVARDALLNAGSRRATPPDPAALRRIAGYGASSTATYQGDGIYFLDKVRPGLWRLEVYPDAVPIRDPFEPPSPDKVVTRAISRAWLMTLTLPDLGTSFTVQPIAAGNQRTERAAAGAFMVTPGVYLLSAAGPVDVATLPPYVGAVGLAEYHAAPLDTLQPSVQSLAASECVAGRDGQLRARVVDRTPPDSAKLFIRPAAGGVYRGVTMHATGGYVYSATVSAAALREGG